MASAALDVLAVEVAAAREEPVRLVRLDPYRAHAALDRPIPFELLAEQVLARLVSPAPDERAPGVIFVVDASRALPQDDEGWSQLFQRLNEQRNGIAKALEGPLVLVVPGRLEAAFAHAAPDFWSIRSLAVVVDAPPGVRPEAVEPAEERRERLVEPAPEQAWSAAEIEAEVAAARARLADATEDESALSSLIVWLGRQVQHEMDRGTLDRALRAAEESLLLERRQAEKHPGRVEWLHDLSLSLDNAGDVYRARGNLERALAAYDESLSLRRRLLALDSARPEWLRDLSSLSLRRRLLALDPARPEWRHDLAASLSQHAITAEAAGRPADALSFWRAALDELDDLTRRPAPLEAWNTAAATCRAEISRLEESLQPHDARRSDPPPA
ncbi:hypothetical protein WMF11_03725 [Sorangium sp. So ce295]|uniref:hypothetical protein n=1 Tax=Sorangium sp. So ce295 TaxID=3133295 RepID=UPI003F62132F